MWRHVVDDGQVKRVLGVAADDVPPCAERTPAVNRALSSLSDYLRFQRFRRNLDGVTVYLGWKGKDAKQGPEPTTHPRQG
jgi:hypothetical protein